MLSLVQIWLKPRRIEHPMKFELPNSCPLH